MAIDPLPAGMFSRFNQRIEATYPVGGEVSCDGKIERVNGHPLAPNESPRTRILSLDGWVAVSAREGKAADDVFVTPAGIDGKTRYIDVTRKPRPDINERFGQPNMADVGFAMNTEIDVGPGIANVGLARTYQGIMQPCRDFKVKLELDGKQ